MEGSFSWIFYVFVHWKLNNAASGVMMFSLYFLEASKAYGLIL